MTGVTSQSFNVVSELRTIGGVQNVQVLLLGLASVDDNNGGTYRWESTSTATDNGFTVIKVANITTGRWLRVGNANTIKGTFTFSAITLQTAYTVTYKDSSGNNIVLPYVPFQIYIQARTAQAAVPSWVSNITNSGFTLNFSTVPLVGTLNLTVDWLAIKQ